MKKIIVLTLSIVILTVFVFMVFIDQETTLREVITENGNAASPEGVIEKVIFKKQTTEGTMITEITDQGEINDLLNSDVQLSEITNPSERKNQYVMAIHFKDADYAHEYLTSENYILLRDALETHNMYEVIDDNYIYEYIQLDNLEWVLEKNS